ncbi:hypothetical protein [Nocardioides sp. AN3]
MFTTIRTAALSAELDERQATVALAGACPWVALAALGSFAGRVAGVIVHDRRLVRRWLDSSQEVAA